MVEFVSRGVKVEEYKELLEYIHGLAIIAVRQYESTITFERLKKKAGGKKV
jgi:hypothetical protein